MSFFDGSVFLSKSELVGRCKFAFVYNGMVLISLLFIVIIIIIIIIIIVIII